MASGFSHSTNLSRASASNLFLRPEQLVDRRLASRDGHLSGAFHFAAFSNDRSRRRIIGPSSVIWACSMDAKLNSAVTAFICDRSFHREVLSTTQWRGAGITSPRAHDEGEAGGDQCRSLPPNAATQLVIALTDRGRTGGLRGCPSDFFKKRARSAIDAS